MLPTTYELRFVPSSFYEPDLARLEQNAIPIKLSPTPLIGIVSKIVEDMGTVAADTNVVLAHTITPDTPAVIADSDRIKQVLYNLIGNALKFSTNGSVTISAEAVDGIMKIRVSDTGRGIPPEIQPMLFAHYKQVRSSDASKGSGLGLYISRLLIEKMGGKIYIESSTPDKGTIITFTLPLASEDSTKKAV